MTYYLPPPPTASLIAAPEPEPTYMAVVGLALYIA